MLPDHPALPLPGTLLGQLSQNPFHPYWVILGDFTFTPPFLLLGYTFVLVLVMFKFIQLFSLITPKYNIHTCTGFYYTSREFYIKCVSSLFKLVSLIFHFTFWIAYRQNEHNLLFIYYYFIICMTFICNLNYMPSYIGSIPSYGKCSLKFMLLLLELMLPRSIDAEAWSILDVLRNDV